MSASGLIKHAKYLQFEKEYFKSLKYSEKKELIKRHAYNVLKWGSEASNYNLLDGRNKTALDVGCAYGYGTAVLSSLGYDAYGIDLSSYSVRQAKKDEK